MHIEPNTLVSKHAFLCYSYELQHDTYAYLHDGSQSMSKFSLMKSIMRPIKYIVKGQIRGQQTYENTFVAIIIFYSKKYTITNTFVQKLQGYINNFLVRYFLLL